MVRFIVALVVSLTLLAPTAPSAAEPPRSVSGASSFGWAYGWTMECLWRPQLHLCWMGSALGGGHHTASVHTITVDADAAAGSVVIEHTTSYVYNDGVDSRATPVREQVVVELDCLVYVDEEEGPALLASGEASGERYRFRVVTNGVGFSTSRGPAVCGAPTSAGLPGVFVFSS